jgi:hypothetical protein
MIIKKIFTVPSSILQNHQDIQDNPVSPSSKTRHYNFQELQKIGSISCPSKADKSLKTSSALLLISNYGVGCSLISHKISYYDHIQKDLTTIKIKKRSSSKSSSI